MLIAIEITFLILILDNCLKKLISEDQKDTKIVS